MHNASRVYCQLNCRFGRQEQTIGENNVRLVKTTYDYNVNLNIPFAIMCPYSSVQYYDIVNQSANMIDNNA